MINYILSVYGLIWIENNQIMGAASFFIYQIKSGYQKNQQLFDIKIVDLWMSLKKWRTATQVHSCSTGHWSDGNA